MEEKIKNANYSDVEYVRRMMQAAHGGSRMPAVEDTQKKLALQEEETMQHDIHSFEKGYETLIAELKNQATVDSYLYGEEGESLPVEDFILSDEQLKQLLDKKRWHKDMQGEEEIAITEYTQEVLLAFYKLAVDLDVNKMHAESTDAFRFLCKLAPRVSSFWIGLGLALEGNQEYNLAIEAFQKAISVNASDFTPFLGMIRCCQQFKNYSKVIELLEKQKENKEIQEEVNEALAYIQSLEHTGG